MLETSNFVHGSAMRCLSLVMSECSLNGRGQGHVSNFYIVDLENFATASRRYTGDIHNSTVVGLFMTLLDNESDSIASLLSAHVYYTLSHCNPPIYNFDLFRTCRTSIVSALLRGNWQDFIDTTHRGSLGDS